MLPKKASILSKLNFPVLNVLVLVSKLAYAGHTWLLTPCTKADPGIRVLVGSETVDESIMSIFANYNQFLEYVIS